MRLLVGGQWFSINQVQLYHLKAVEKRAAMIRELSGDAGSYWLMGGVAEALSVIATEGIMASAKNKRIARILPDLSSLEAEMKNRARWFDIQDVEILSAHDYRSWFASGPANESSSSKFVKFSALPDGYIETRCGDEQVTIRWDHVSAVALDNRNAASRAC